MVIAFFFLKPSICTLRTHFLLPYFTLCKAKLLNHKNSSEILVSSLSVWLLYILIIIQCHWHWYALPKILVIYGFSSFSLPHHIFCLLLRSTCGWSWFPICTASMRSPSSSPPPPRLALNCLYLTLLLKINYLSRSLYSKGFGVDPSNLREEF